MGYRDWVIVGAVVFYAGGQIVPPYTHLLDWKEHYHLHVEDQRTVSTVTALPTNTSITPGTGTLKIEVEERVRVGLNERVDIEKIEK